MEGLGSWVLSREAKIKQLERDYKVLHDAFIMFHLLDRIPQDVKYKYQQRLLEKVQELVKKEVQ